MQQEQAEPRSGLERSQAASTTHSGFLTAEDTFNPDACVSQHGGGQKRRKRGSTGCRRKHKRAEALGALEDIGANGMDDIDMGEPSP